MARFIGKNTDGFRTYLGMDWLLFDSLFSGDCTDFFHPNYPVRAIFATFRRSAPPGRAQQDTTLFFPTQ
jgi:hypothetical protein